MTSKNTLANLLVTSTNLLSNREGFVSVLKTLPQNAHQASSQFANDRFCE